MSVSQQRRPAPERVNGGDPTLERARRLADELARRWAAGERPPAEEFLADDPDLTSRPDAALEIIYEEMCQRQQAETADDPRWFERFPAWQGELQMLLACHCLLDAAGELRFPEVGGTFGEFLLLAELGRGLHGRVYVARQPALADRPVVLKVTPLAGQEHLSLARLQHTHIVPLYGAHDDASLGLRALCMPYFGGATLAQVLQRLRPIAPAKRTGRDLVDALTAAAGDQPLGPSVDGPACRYLRRATYVEAVCWLGACLVDALADAHQRGIVHLDLKPSNVLLAADGQPMLLDFHLAQPPITLGQASLEWLGGTPGYMPPEQQAALEAIRSGGDVPQRVDGRADVYSLALVLCESLAGLPPEGTPPARWLRATNPKIGVALSDLLTKCLSPDADLRYPEAASLAEDLRRHLAHRPLRHVANRSLAERWSKWRSRRPYALAFLALFAALATGALVAVAGFRQRLHDAQAGLDEVEESLTAGRFERAVTAAQQARYWASGVPWSGRLGERLRRAERLSEAGQVANDLHALVERCRGSDVDFRPANGRTRVPPHESRLLYEQAERLWRRRELIAASVADRALAGVAERAYADLAELAIMWADLHVRLAPAERDPQAGREALAVLKEAESLPGAKLVLCRAQEQLARMLGDERVALELAERADRLRPSTAWQYLTLGRLLLKDDRLEEAAAEFASAADLEPQSLWTNFYAGRTAYELGRFDEAVSSYTACVALAPRAAWCYDNRGLAQVGAGRFERARGDFDRALELDPDLASVALHRGNLCYHENRYDEALADLNRALAGGVDPAVVHYHLALVYAARQESAAALEHLDQVLSFDPKHQPAREFADKLRGHR